ncbi:MAG: hypothetical protein C0436_00865 [Alphaproteobacteria bacterium]|nr:hypothetical protein [Alphaproteobacteria bacterium]
MSATPALSLAERRLTERLLTYWQAMAKHGLMPREEDIDPEALGDLWPKCFLIQTFDIKHRRDMNFTYLGQEIIDAYQDGMMNEGQNVLVSPNASKLALSFHQVMESTAPVVAEGEFLALSGRVVRYRQCLLPLGEGDDVQAIFGGMSFKAY